MSEDVPLPPPHFGPSHYYGDTVRILFVIAAVLLLASQFVGSPFLTPIAALVLAVVLVIMAGLTNPVQTWVQWANVILSALCLFLFGSMALTRYKETGDIFGENFIILLLTVVFIIGLYLATRTLRGVLMRDAPIIR